MGVQVYTKTGDRSVSAMLVWHYCGIHPVSY